VWLVSSLPSLSQPTKKKKKRKAKTPEDMVPSNLSGERQKFQRPRQQQKKDFKT
jgi:hypothetical protein